MIVQILGYLLIITGILDALKYSIQATKIRRAGTAKAMSRKFGLISMVNGLARVSYAVAIHDFFLFTSSILAVVCILRLWWIIYLFYPYRGRNLINFKRPGLFHFTVNAIIPNNYRKRL